VRHILRVTVALFAVAALAGGVVAFADHGPGGSSGSGSESGSGEHGAKHHGDHGRDKRTADVYTLAEPQHSNPEGVAFDKRSGFFFVSATGDGSI
jgi:hypothetical protein